MRIDKFLSNMGEGSRTYIKKLIKSSLVTVDGNIIKSPDTKININQKVCINGREIIYNEYIYIMLNKPSGVISATEDKNKTVIDLLEDKLKLMDLFPVGRLDKDTEGLLIITNDGQLSHNLLSPKKHIEKTYYAKINGQVENNNIDLFKLGIKLDDGYTTLPSTLKIIKNSSISEIELTIVEGKYHQVKRMFEAINRKVIYLKRISIGNLKLDNNLKLGEYRQLTVEELNMLKL